MKHLKRVTALILAILLLASLTACSKSGLSGSGLPVIYLDGKAYPVTAEDGVKGLETLYNGVIVMHREYTYDAVLDIEVLTPKYVLYRADGTVDQVYSGPHMIYLESEFPSPITSGADPTAAPFYALTVLMGGAPMPDLHFSDVSDFSRTMAENGFIRFYKDEARCCRFYTTNGPVEISTDTFEAAMREHVRNLRDYSPENQDPVWVENYIENNRAEVMLFTANGIMYSELTNGTSQIGCMLVVDFDEETGNVSTAVQLTASRELLDLWYRQWSPAFGEEIAPKG